VKVTPGEFCRTFDPLNNEGDCKRVARCKDRSRVRREQIEFSFEQDRTETAETCDPHSFSNCALCRLPHTPEILSQKMMIKAVWWNETINVNAVNVVSILGSDADVANRPRR